MSKELRRCPFCGGEAGVSERYDEYCAVRCITCGAKTNFSMTKKGAIELWNRREPMDEVMEQLDSLKEHELSMHDFSAVRGIKRAIEIVKGGA